MWLVRKKTYEMEVIRRTLAEEKVEAQTTILREMRHENSMLFTENQRLRHDNEQLRGKGNGDISTSG